MNAFRRADAPAWATVFFAIVLLASMTFSPFLLSLGMWGFVGVALWEAARQRRGAFSGGWTSRVWQVLRFSFIRWWQRPLYFGFVLLFAVVLISGLWSADQQYWLERTRVRLPFFILPWAFANLPELSARQLRLPLYVLVFWLVVLCAGIGVNMLMHYAEIMDGLRKGQPIPVPRSHIRFALMLVAGVVAGAWLLREAFYLRYVRERILLVLALVFLVVFLHLLSVRSGLAALYAVLFSSLIWYVVHTRRWLPALLAFLVLCTVPWIAVKTLPSLAQRVSYMRYDWERFRAGEGANYSDSERWISFRSGMRLWQEHPLIGVGAGDLPQETARVLARDLPEYKETPKLPHNQFLYILSGTGIFGLALSMAAFAIPFSRARFRGNYLLMMFQVVVGVSFLVEYTIETSIGVAFYLFFTLWLMKMAD